ncbi:NlpC/P60 family protein, partial [Desulfobacterales bacterium HSG16]|nr:NlpC/P60 family protein [Desulfobacterales bacterium HSG16]
MTGKSAFRVVRLLIVLLMLMTMFSCSSWKSKVIVVSDLPPLEKDNGYNYDNARIYEKFTKKTGFRLDGTENPELIRSLNSWMGVQYQWGGCSKYGVDCSCFVKAVYSEVYGINLRRTTRAMYHDMAPVRKYSLEEGDVLFFKMDFGDISHVGIYLKNGRFAHASKSKGVMINHLGQRYYNKRFYVGGRYQETGSSYGLRKKSRKSA